MKVMRLHAISNFRLEGIETLVPKGDEILVRIDACGTCGPDIPRIYQLGTRVYPVVIGYELSGTIYAVGNPEDGALIGRKAAIFPLISCREYEPREIEQFRQCENYNYLGSRSNGGFAEYCLLPSHWHLVLAQGEDIGLEALSMCELVCVVQHALRRGDVTAGQAIAILGTGPTGIMTARWASLFGVSQVTLTDTDEAK